MICPKGAEGPFKVKLAYQTESSHIKSSFTKTFESYGQLWFINCRSEAKWLLFTTNHSVSLSPMQKSQAAIIMMSSPQDLKCDLCEELIKIVDDELKKNETEVRFSIMYSFSVQ